MLPIYRFGSTGAAFDVAFAMTKFQLRQSPPPKPKTMHKHCLAFPRVFSRQRQKLQSRQLRVRSVALSSVSSSSCEARKRRAYDRLSDAGFLNRPRSEPGPHSLRKLFLSAFLVVFRFACWTLLLRYLSARPQGQLPTSDAMLLLVGLCATLLALFVTSFVLTIPGVTTPMVLPPKKEARFLQPLLAKINALAFSRLLPRWQSQRCFRMSMRNCAGAKMTRDALCVITFCYPILIVSSWSSACLPKNSNREFPENGRLW